MRNPLTLEFKVGVFVILALAVLLVAVFYKGKITTGRGYDITVRFGYVGGLGKGAPVMVSGVRVGEVRSLGISKQEKQTIVDVRIRLQPQVRVSRNSEVSIRTLGMIGDKYVEITPAEDAEFVQAGEELRGTDPLPLERFLASGEDIITNLDGILKSVNRMVSDKAVQEHVRGILKNANVALADVHTVLARVDNLVAAVEGTNAEVRGLVADARPRVETVLAQTGRFAEDGAKFVASLDERVGRFTEEGAKLMAKLGERADEFSGTGQEFAKTSAEVRTFIAELRTKGLVAQMMREEELLNQIKQEIVSLQETTTVVKEGAEKFGKLCDDVSSVVDGVRRGDGTLGRLLEDEGLYRQTVEAVRSVRTLVDDIRTHPWKFLFGGSRPREGQ